jgi:transposase
MPKCDDLSRSLVAFDQDSTLVAAIELSSSSWLVGGLVPGLAREPMKRLAPDAAGVLRLLERWREEAAKAGRPLARICVAYEAGRDGFWLARFLRARGVECQVIHPASVAVSRAHRRAKTDRLDLALLKRAFLGWLRGERKHCSMVAVPTRAAEDAKRPLRERAALTGEATRRVNRRQALLALHGIRGFKIKLKKARERLPALVTAEGAPLPPHLLAELARAMERLSAIKAQIATLDAERCQRLAEAPAAPALILLLARVVGVGTATAELLVREAFSRTLRDRRAAARYVGLTGSPDESGRRRREQGLAKAGNGRLRRALIQLAWRFLVHQPDCALVRWYRAHRGRAARGPQGDDCRAGPQAVCGAMGIGDTRHHPGDLGGRALASGRRVSGKTDQTRQKQSKAYRRPSAA